LLVATPIEPESSDDESEGTTNDEEATSNQNDETITTLDFQTTDTKNERPHSDSDSTPSEGDETGRHADARREARDIRRDYRERERKAKLLAEDKAKQLAQETKSIDTNTTNWYQHADFSSFTFTITDDADDYYLPTLESNFKATTNKGSEHSTTQLVIPNHYDWFGIRDDTPKELTSNQVLDRDMVTYLCDSESSIRYLTTVIPDKKRIIFNRVEDPHYDRAS